MNIIITEYPYLSILITISILLGFIVFLNNRKAIQNKTFLLMQLTISLWLFANHISDLSSFSKYVDLIMRIDYYSAILGVSIFLYFSYIFPAKKTIPNLIVRPLYTLNILLFFVIFFTNLVLKQTTFNNGSIVNEGGLSLIYYAIIIGLFIHSCINLAIAIPKNNSKQRKQVLIIFLGLASLAFFTLFSNIFLPKMFPNVPEISRYGSIGVLVFLFCCSYTILKYQLFNIKIILTEAIVILISIFLLLDTLTSTIFALALIRSFLFIGSVSGGYILIKSIKTEIKQKEKLERLSKKLEIANEHLKELDEAKDNFLSMASHELNTPIAAITGYLSMIIDENMAGPMNETMSRYLNQIYGSSKRLANLVRDLLNVSRIESNRVHIIYTEQQIEDVIKQSVGELAMKAKEMGHSLTFEKPAHKLPKTYIDAPRITEVIINFIGNAIKYTTPPGKIVIRTYADNDKIVVSVEDNGRGIPKEKYDHIFEKFSQVDVLKDEVKGTGLGMFISKNLIEMHKGKIWFKSNTDPENHGSTFFFSVPIYKEKPYDPHENEGALFATGKPKNEIIVNNIAPEAKEILEKIDK